MITISHTHAEGTTLSGSRKGDGVYDIVAPHGFRYSRNVGIYIRGSRDRDAQQWRIDAAAQALRDKGFDVTVEVDDGWRPAAQREAARGERADDRAERLDEQAHNAAGRRDARQAAADQVLAAIPGGQPMLIGHHSYPADRRRRERAWDNLGKAVAEDQRATALTGRASGVRDNETAKDNPRAIMRRVERLEADLRREQRELAAAVEAQTSDSYQARVQRRIDRLTEDIGHQNAKLAERAATGEFLAWGPDNLAVGDLVRVGGHGWHKVTRVNRKTVSLDNRMWPTKAPFDGIFGRRRDGLQHDTPNGQPWPVALAKAVARWQHLLGAARNPGYDDEQQRRARHVGYARRLVHGLDLSASDAQAAAFWPDEHDPETLPDRRRLCAAYLAVFDRLESGELVPAILASLDVDPAVPSWRMPDGEPVDRRPQDLHPGDVIAGLWEHGYDGRKLWPYFTGPVAEIRPVEPRSERGDWRTVVLTDGTSRDFKTCQWLAVHCCPAS